jgi:alpha-tubulin suppressor-like RCC1 family protein
LYCWGSNYYGQLGQDKTNSELPSSEKPTLIPLTSVEEVSTSGGNICAITSSEPERKVYCWGNNFLPGASVLGDGDGTVHQRNSPYHVNYPDLTIPDKLAVSFSTSCVRLKKDSGQYHTACWGSSDYFSNAPQTLDLFYDISGDSLLSISLGVDHLCTTSGTSGVNCKGSNVYGQVGNGLPSNIKVTVPVKLSATPAHNLALGAATSCMIHSNLNDAQDPKKYVYCWGNNDKGQLGNGTFDPVIKPGTTIYTKGN